jgi:hypothetical protein
MKIRKLLRKLHRDFGYFIVGMTIVYALSGIILNHRHDFNPDYKIFVSEFQTEFQDKTNLTQSEIESALQILDHKVVYKKHYLTNRGIVKVFIESGEVLINPKTGKGVMRYLRKRPIVYGMNRLHTSALGTAWKWGSDAMAAIMLFVAVSGLFILKGKRGFNRWGWWLTAVGIIIPLIFTLLFI